MTPLPMTPLPMTPLPMTPLPMTPLTQNNGQKHQNSSALREFNDFSSAPLLYDLLFVVLFLLCFFLFLLLLLCHHYLAPSSFTTSVVLLWRLSRYEGLYLRRHCAGALGHCCRRLCEYVVDCNQSIKRHGLCTLFDASTCAPFSCTEIGVLDTDCPNDCSQAGSCQGNVCVCHDFYTGVDCSVCMCRIRCG
jgi:hypothetical protein